MNPMVTAFHISINSRRAFCNIIWWGLIKNVHPIAMSVLFMLLFKLIICPTMFFFYGFIIMGKSVIRIETISIIGFFSNLTKQQRFCSLQSSCIPLYVVSPVKKKKQERSFGNLPTLIFLDNEHVHPVRSMDSPKFFLSNVEHNTLFLKVAK